MKKLFFITLLALSGSVLAQNVPIPIVLTQRLPWAPATVQVGGNCNIDVILDTADFIDIITSGSIAEADSMTFPKGKITLDEATKRLTFDKNIPIKKGIRVHTTTRNLTIDASQYSSVVLRSTSGYCDSLDHLALISDNFAMICVESPVKATETNIDARSYSWIRYIDIEGKQIYTTVRGNARVLEIGENSDRVEESAYGVLFQRDHQQIPLFMEYSFGTTAIGNLPSHSSYIKGDNYIWGSSPLPMFNYQFRYAFWANNHWSLSAGFGVHVESFRVDNAYIDLVFDSLTSLYSFQAQNSSALFAQEEAQNGKIYWNSSIAGVTYLTLPICLEWRSRADYRGFRFGAELLPAVAFYRKNALLRRNGFYADKDMVAATSNDRLGKIINPFRLDMRLSAAYGHIGIFAQTSLTPLFRSKTDNADSKPALDQKLFPSSIGITFMF